MARLVLSDASPLIGLARVDGVGWLRSLFGEVEITRSVYDELAADRIERGIRAAIDAGWLIPRERDHEGAHRPPHLGAGEWTTILAAGEHVGPCLVLLDERLARREAISRGLSIAGTAAVIGMAHTRGLIPSAREVFERLLQTDFRLSPVIIRNALAHTERRNR